MWKCHVGSPAGRADARDDRPRDVAAAGRGVVVAEHPPPAVAASSPARWKQPRLYQGQQNQRDTYGRDVPGERTDYRNGSYVERHIDNTRDEVHLRTERTHASSAPAQL